MAEPGLMSCLRMKRALSVGIGLLLLGGCTSYYLESNLNSLSVGTSKTQMLSSFGGRTSQGGQAHPLLFRHAKRTPSGVLVEVGEMPMWSDRYSRDVTYWFLFENGSLVQWGQPQDWPPVARRYEIDLSIRNR